MLRTERKEKSRAAWLVLIMAVTLGTFPAWAVEPYSTEPAKPKVSDQLPASLVENLDPTGTLLFTYSNGLKEAICEIFWAKTVALQSTASTGLLRYSDLKPGSFVGVIHLLPEATEDYYEDYHNQKLKPGFYTMRYAVLPAGIGANGPIQGDFLVLSPARLDRDARHILPSEDLVKLGRLVSRTDLPASMRLVSADVKTDPFPPLKTDDVGICVMQVMLHGKPVSGAPPRMALAMVVVTPVPDLGGS
jgi:hypothetical protein